MKYTFSCDDCFITFEVERSMRDMPMPVKCPVCGKIGKRVYNPFNVTWGKGCWQFGDDGMGDEPVHNF